MFQNFDSILLHGPSAETSPPVLPMLNELRSTPFTVAKMKNAATIVHTGKLQDNRILQEEIAKDEVLKAQALRTTVFARLVNELSADDCDGGE